MGIKRTQLVAVTALTGTAAQIYVAPSLTWAQITAATVLNPTGASVTVKVYLVPAAGTAAVANQVVQKTLLAGESASLAELLGQTLLAGTQITAEGNQVNITISGVEFTQ